MKIDEARRLKVIAAAASINAGRECGTAAAVEFMGDLGPDSMCGEGGDYNQSNSHSNSHSHSQSHSQSYPHTQSQSQSQSQVLLDDNLMERTCGRPFPLKHRAKVITTIIF